MIITKQQLEGGAYEMINVANRDTLSETGPLKPGMIAGKDGTRVILLDKSGNPEEGPPDPAANRLRTENLVLVFAVVGSLFASAAQFAMLASTGSDAALVSHKAKARIGEILSTPPEDADIKDRNAIPRLWVKSE